MANVYHASRRVPFDASLARRHGDYDSSPATYYEEFDLSGLDIQGIDAVSINGVLSRLFDWDGQTLTIFAFRTEPDDELVVLCDDPAVADRVKIATAPVDPASVADEGGGVQSFPAPPDFYSLVGVDVNGVLHCNPATAYESGGRIYVEGAIPLGVPPDGDPSETNIIYNRRI